MKPPHKWTRVFKKAYTREAPIVYRKSLFKAFKRLLREDDGPTAVEYAVMLSLIVGACVGAVRALSTATSDSFTESADAIQAAMGP